MLRLPLDMVQSGKNQDHNLAQFIQFLMVKENASTAASNSAKKKKKYSCVERGSFCFVMSSRWGIYPTVSGCGLERTAASWFVGTFRGLFLVVSVMCFRKCSPDLHPKKEEERT